MRRGAQRSSGAGEAEVGYGDGDGDGDRESEPTAKDSTAQIQVGSACAFNGRARSLKSGRLQRAIPPHNTHTFGTRASGELRGVERTPMPLLLSKYRTSKRTSNFYEYLYVLLARITTVVVLVLLSLEYVKFSVQSSL